jgi:translation initiation factor IF-3
MKIKKIHKINSEINHPTVRLGEYGIISLKEAKAIADAEELDLVLLNENSNPVICKIMNYEKFMYEQSKKPKHKPLDVKEVKLGPNMSSNDISYREKHIIEFLGKGHKIKLSMQFRGREMAFIDKGKELMLKLILSLEDYCSAESVPKLEGKKIICVLKPKPKK